VCALLPIHLTALSQTRHNHKCLCPTSVLFLPLSTRALSRLLIAAALLWRRGSAGAASASGSVLGSACKQPTTNALRTMRAPSYCSTQVHGYCSRLVGVHCNPYASQVRVAAYPAVERVELLRLYQVVLISIQPARGTQLSGAHEAKHKGRNYTI
jgi:hypothetical protein